MRATMEQFAATLPSIACSASSRSTQNPPRSTSADSTAPHARPGLVVLSYSASSSGSSSARTRGSVALGVLLTSCTMPYSEAMPHF
jgi:hypothetical protein